MNTTEKKLHDLKISGSGTFGGGEFNTVKISGSGTIQGNVSCKDLKISGSGKIEGDVTSDEFKTSGSSKIKGNIHTKEIGISGSTTIDGSITALEMTVSGASKVGKDLTCKKFKSSGSTKIGGKLQGGLIKSSGSLQVENDCEVETFTSKGSVKINGLLSADKVEIHIGHDSFIKEIGGETIEVRNEHSTKLLKQVMNFFMQRSDHLKTELIEGDEILLENTKAKLVRGKNVIIGENCEIETVEYSGICDVKDGGKVERKVKN
ncbi:polymer-forming cytoskeletal protein [Rossellomorea aquimaris]|uniref:polymer-forming cytoskeletal protein n=1 Tax=Rossellomorea aquimaris TaxID=189382 RepID=UPI001CD363F9|nr:polymer-forming cytoskeletal protein [Rossellomorea aquimaris]MCA1055633.1 polymer-forming cytoskeletal protein [Rossellomorea aquimaris]